MNDSILLPVKRVAFFGEEHVNWKNICEVIIFFGYTNFELSKLDCSTSFYHNSTNTGPIDMFFTKNSLLFTGNKKESSIFVSVPQKMVLWHSVLIFFQKDN